MRMPIVISGALGILLALWVGWGAYVIYTTERPPYQVVRRLTPRVEIRQYEAQTWIATNHTTDGSSFRVLASYIFGKNQQGQKVAMTAPVITDEKMIFVLPEGLTADNAPTPDGQSIDFTEVPPRKLGTLRFSWSTPPDRVRRKTEQLLEVLEDNGIRAKNRPFLMRYNDPWTPPFMRRNEVAVEVE